MIGLSSTTHLTRRATRARGAGSGLPLLGGDPRVTLGAITPSGRQRGVDRKLTRDLRLLARFVEIYCNGRHPDANRRPFALKTHDTAQIVGRTLHLCPACSKLLQHAWTKRTHCPFDPKPQCKHCPKHCYNPTYRHAMQDVMRYAGRKLVLSGRLDYLVHLFL